MVVPMKYARVEARSRPCTGATYILPGHSDAPLASQLAVCEPPSPSLPLPHTLQASAAERSSVALPGRRERGVWVGCLELCRI